MHPAPAQDFADLEIRIDPLRGDDYPVALVVDGEREFFGSLTSSILPWVPSALPGHDGQQLFNLLFASASLRSGWDEARGKGRRRLRLGIGAAAPELHAIPWELLQEHTVALAAAGDTPFSRYLYGGWEPGQPVPGRPVRMLIAIANPDGLDQYKLQAIEVEKEWRSIQAAASHAGMELELLPQPCTLSALIDQVAQGFHILHLVCHGAYSRGDGAAALFLASNDNQVQLVYDHELAAHLRNRLPAVPHKDRLRLVFLASCETATRSPADAFRGLAPQLVRAGVPSVVAMQDQVPVETARQFAATFYRRLLEHGLVDLACNQARAAVLAVRLPGAAIPVLFSRLRDGRLLELPQDDGRPAIDRRKPFEPKTVLIPGGPFLMGTDDPTALKWEQPQHSVSLPDFRLGKYPVTNRHYAAFIKDNKDQDAPQGWFNREPPPDHLDHPVTSVSWYDAVAYCAWLSEQTSRRFTLPSEAEWEKAACSNESGRAALQETTEVVTTKYPWGAEWIEGRCNAAGSGTEAVTAHPDGASAYGVEDLLGNVQEWTRSLWGSQPAPPAFGYPYDPDDGREIADPKKLPAPVRVVHRGGSFKSVPTDLRCSARGNALPDSKIAWRGFRVVLEA